MELGAAIEFARTTKESVLATIRSNGRPQLSSVWHHVDDGGTIRVSITANRAKYPNLVHVVSHAKLDPALAFRPLFRDNAIIVGRKNHPLRNAGSIAHLSTAVWVRGVLERGIAAGSVNQLFSAANLPIPRTIVQCDSYSITMSVIAKSDALGVIVRRFLATAPACDLLQEIKIAEPMPTVTIGLIMRKDPPLTPIAAAMAKVVTAVARQLA